METMKLEKNKNNVCYVHNSVVVHAYDLYVRNELASGWSSFLTLCSECLDKLSEVIVNMFNKK